MAQHINNICNLSNIDGEKVKFITTDNYGVTQSLKNTGDIVLFRDNDRHDIYVGGEHIAGGYGFDDDSPIEKLNDVAITYYTYLHHLNYIDENFNTIKKVVDEYKWESDDEEVEPDLTNECYLNIKDLRFTYVDSLAPNIISNTDEALIVQVGTNISFENLLLDIEGNCDIAYLDIYSQNYFDNLDDSIKYSKRYTHYVVHQSYYETTYELNNGNYSHSEINGSDVTELSLSQPGTIHNYTDNVLLAVKHERMYQSQGMPLEFVSKPIYWQLPYLFGSHEITAENFNEYNWTLGSLVYRDDYSVDTMINKEISIQFNENFAQRSHGYFACPQQWGEPIFTHKESGLTHYWEKITTNPIQCNVNGVITNYNVYRTKLEYYKGDPIKWIVSNTED